MLDTVDISPNQTRITLRPEGVRYLDSLGADRVPVEISDGREGVLVRGYFVKVQGRWHFQDDAALLSRSLRETPTVWGRP